LVSCEALTGLYLLEKCASFCTIFHGIITSTKQLSVGMSNLSRQFSCGHGLNPLHSRKFNFIAWFMASKNAGNRWTFIEEVASFGQLIYSLLNPVLFLAVEAPSITL